MVHKTIHCGIFFKFTYKGKTLIYLFIRIAGKMIIIFIFFTYMRMRYLCMNFIELFNVTIKSSIWWNNVFINFQCSNKLLYLVLIHSSKKSLLFEIFSKWLQSFQLLSFIFRSWSTWEILFHFFLKSSVDGSTIQIHKLRMSI